MSKTIDLRKVIPKILTAAELRQCCSMTVSEIAAAYTAPRIDRINEILGQENDAKFIAYMIQYYITAISNGAAI